MLLSLNIETDDGQDQAKEYYQKSKAAFPAYFAGSELLNSYADRGIPVTYFIDRNGNIRFHHLGFDPADDEENFAIIIEELLK